MSPLTAARRNDSDRRRRKVIDALDRLHTDGDEISTLRIRVAELEQQLLDQRQGLQDRDDELTAARAANRDLMTRLNGRTRSPLICKETAKTP